LSLKEKITCDKTGDNLSLSAVKISFSLHHSKKADSHSEDKASYTNVNARTKSLGQAYSIQTFDQQLYAIAKQVEWAK
jgi:hypothetical protein